MTPLVRWELVHPGPPDLLAKCLHGCSRFANMPVVNVISKRCLFEKAAQYPDAKAALQTWFARCLDSRVD